MKGSEEILVDVAEIQRKMLAFLSLQRALRSAVSHFKDDGDSDHGAVVSSRRKRA